VTKIEATKSELERVLRVLDSMNDATSRCFLRDYVRELDATARRLAVEQQPEMVI
jgi:hypothetical protein